MDEQEKLKEYNKYKSEHIKHHSECRMCRGDTIDSNMYEGYRECRACLNNKGEGYFFEPTPPKTIKEYFN